MFEGFIGLSFLLSAFNSFVVAVFQFFLSAIFFRIEFSCEDVKIETANIICEKNIPIQCPSLDMKGTEPMMKKIDILQSLVIHTVSGIVSTSSTMDLFFGCI